MLQSYLNKTWENKITSKKWTCFKINKDGQTQRRKETKRVAFVRENSGLERVERFVQHNLLFVSHLSEAPSLSFNWSGPGEDRGFVVLFVFHMSWVTHNTSRYCFPHICYFNVKTTFVVCFESVFDLVLAMKLGLDDMIGILRV